MKYDSNVGEFSSLHHKMWRILFGFCEKDQHRKSRCIEIDVVFSLFRLSSSSFGYRVETQYSCGKFNLHLSLKTFAAFTVFFRITLITAVFTSTVIIFPVSCELNYCSQTDYIEMFCSSSFCFYVHSTLHPSWNNFFWHHDYLHLAIILALFCVALN